MSATCQNVTNFGSTCVSGPTHNSKIAEPTQNLCVSYPYIRTRIYVPEYNTTRGDEHTKIRGDEALQTLQSWWQAACHSDDDDDNDNDGKIAKQHDNEGDNAASTAILFVARCDSVANAIIADIASKTTKTADVVIVVSRVPPPHLVAPVPLGRRDDAIASPEQWLPSASAAMMAAAMTAAVR